VDVDSLQRDLQQTLGRGSSWLRSLRTADIAFRADGIPDLRTVEELVEKIRVRAASSLLKVAMFGAFSSGKSFLLSGLQGRLSVEQVADEHGEMDVMYVGLLPSAGGPMNACPATVVPVDRLPAGVDSDRGVMRVRFVGDDNFEELGETPQPPVVAAYITQRQDYIMLRPPQHRTRTVAEIEVDISSALIPAKLFDLPGYGAPIEEHDLIAREAIAEADCIVYVSSAVRTLDDRDLDLISFLYDHHVHSGKAMLWVLSGIDRAKDIDAATSQPGWRGVLSENNQYLRDNYRRDGAPDLGFIGRGFIPVSPAWEAKGRQRMADGDAARGQRLVARSQMDELRRALLDLIVNGSGVRHLAQAAVEAREAVAPVIRVLQDTLDAERLPIDQLTGEKSSLESRIVSLDRAVAATQDQLRETVAARIHDVEASFRGLARHLHNELDEPISSADLTKNKTANEIEVKKAQVVRAWMALPGGPIAIWETARLAMIDAALLAVRAALDDGVHAGSISTDKVNANDLTVPSSQRSRTRRQELVRNSAALFSSASTVGTVALAALGVVTGPMLLIPGGVAAGTALLYGALRFRARKVDALDLVRRAWIHHLDEIAEAMKVQFVDASSRAGEQLVDRVGDILRGRKNELLRTKLTIDRRLADNSERRDLIDELEPICRDAQSLLVSLEVIAAKAG
jgi:hypothetical protein